MAPPQVFFIGNNNRGQCFLPDGTITVPTAAPRDWLSDGTLVLKMAVGNALTLQLADDNLLFAVGNNEYGQLGRGHSNYNDPTTASRAP